MKHQRHSLDATFKDDGTMVLVQTAIPKKELPKAVLRAAAQLYPGASLKQAGAVLARVETADQSPSRTV